MSSKKKDIAGDLARGRLVKKAVATTDEDARSVIKKVSQKEKKKTIRTTLDLPVDVHTAMKVRVAKDINLKSIKEYVIRLVTKDLDLD